MRIFCRKHSDPVKEKTPDPFYCPETIATLSRKDSRPLFFVFVKRQA